ncbi:MAG TPA: UbiA-like polyprenyltransferase [Candidatus Eisenbacteria bacterium]|nr:UbiA-like polyprenyltransferase [Candidatus Eisenbacteria bacterium]
MALLRSIIHNTGTTLEMIKWEHSVLTLPFGLTGAVLAARGLPSPHTSIWIIVALVAARSAAMAFNRLVDADIDAENPRTKIRALPAGKLSKQFVLGFVVVTSGILIFAAWQLNPLAFYLSPVALAVVFLYSFTKRFTRWAHLVLGVAMGIAPAAAWIAVRGSFNPRILLLTGAVMFWGAGFDILYSCQDYEFDHSFGVHSIPRAFGIRNSLLIARAFHIVTVVFLVWMVAAFGLGKIATVGVVIVAALLVYEHSLVKHDDLSRVNAAFFTMNGFISMGFLFFIAADIMLGRR